MGIRNGIFWIAMVVSVFALSSCSTLKKPVSSKPKPTAAGNKQVRFLDGITLNRSNNGATHYNGFNTTTSRDITMSSANLENAQAWQFKYAQLLDVVVESVRNFRLYGFIEDWWGAPYRMGGKTKAGIDCSGFVTALMSVVFQLSLNGNSQQLYEEVKKLRSRSELQEGDLVFFRIHHKRISHVGVYLDHDRFVHASTSAGVMISDLNEAYWTRYYAGAGRVY